MRSQSSTWISQLYNSVGQINVNQGSWTPGVFYADASTPRATWTLPNGWIINDAPVPASLQPSSDSDAHAVIVDTSRGLEYDFFGLTRSSSSPSGWTASAGVVGRLSGSGWWNNSLGPWGARASGAELVGGLILKTDVTSGSINHALACAAPKSLIGPAISPATTSDGSGGSAAMPMGSRLQLDPSVDLSTLPLEPGEAMVARALQQYGCYVVDSSSTLAIYAQNFNFLPGGTNPYPSSWSNGISRELIKHMRVVDPPATPTYDDRVLVGQPHQ